MTTSHSVVSIADLDVEVVRKEIRNLHLAVYPPSGHVRVAAPHALDDEAVRLAVVSRLAWIRRQRAKVLEQPRESRREMVTGETHYVWGRKFRLRVRTDGPSRGVVLGSNGHLELFVPEGTNQRGCEQRLTAWYRQELKAAIPPLLEKWSKVLGVDSPAWGVKRMKRRWGTCNAEAARIWLNLELVKKPPACLEYVIVHELAHLQERLHNGRVREILDTAMPQWRTYRDELNSTPLAHEDWSY